ncbi:MAG: hypothetical protein R3E31_10085 [Chloroflexota bacterium]
MGRANLLLTAVATSVLEDTWEHGPARNLENVVYAPNGEKFNIVNANTRQLKLCSTCNPRPRDAIVRFMRADGGVTVHKRVLPYIAAQPPVGTHLEVGGAGPTRHAHLITVQVDV